MLVAILLGGFLFGGAIYLFCQYQQTQLDARLKKENEGYVVFDHLAVGESFQLAGSIRVYYKMGKTTYQHWNMHYDPPIQRIDSIYVAVKPLTSILAMAFAEVGG
jgi:hypothetical protein